MMDYLPRSKIANSNNRNINFSIHIKINFNSHTNSNSTKIMPPIIAAPSRKQSPNEINVILPHYINVR